MCLPWDHTRNHLNRNAASPTEWRTLKPDPLDGTYEATPEWILYHLTEHETEHNERISAILSGASRD